MSCAKRALSVSRASRVGTASGIRGYCAYPHRDVEVADMPPPAHSPVRRQVCNALLMVRPTAFGYNAETAQTNRFQHAAGADAAAEVSARALAEFDAFAAALTSEGMPV